MTKPANRTILRTERAHFMCPMMHFGIRVTLPAAFDAQGVQRAVDALAAARPFLRARIQREEGTDALYYDVTAENLSSVSPLPDESAVEAAWARLAEADWDVMTEGLLKVFACPTADGTLALFAAHHLLTDGRGLLGLVLAFARAYVHGMPPVHAEEKLIASLDDLPKGSDLPLVSRLLIDRAGKQWRRENHRVSFAEYRRFAAAYGKAHPVASREDTLDAAELTRVRALCRENGVTVNDWLMAQVFLRTGARKLIIAEDIRPKLRGVSPDALGNCATALGIECTTKTTDPMRKAVEVHARVRQALANPRREMLVLACYLRMEPTLLDAAAISALGGFDSKAGRFVGGTMFGFANPASYSLTNLGQAECDAITSAAFIPPASPAAIATFGALTMNGTLRVVTRVRQAG